MRFGSCEMPFTVTSDQTVPGKVLVGKHCVGAIVWANSKDDANRKIFGNVQGSGRHHE